MIENLDRYNRLFTFGCSFTQYHFPTWANIMDKATPNAKFYNMGKSGSSNTFIANRIVEANRKFKFCETDLIMVMWTTACRETHYVNGKWITPGNIFWQNEYPKDFVEKFADPNGYLIRDMATIELATNYVSSLPCTYMGMLSTPFETYVESSAKHSYPDMSTEITEVYRDLLDSFPESLYQLEFNQEWPTSLSYIPFGMKTERIDYHPTPDRYCQYLIKLGISIPVEVINYANEATNAVYSCKTRDEFVGKFFDLHQYTCENMW